MNSYIINQEIEKLREMYKQAMALAEPTPQTAETMKQNGIYVIQNMISRLPNSTQAQTMEAINSIKQSGAEDFFSTLTPKTAISLPKIYILNPQDVFELNGKKYVTLDIDDGSEWTNPNVVSRAYTSPSGKVYEKAKKGQPPTIYEGEAVLLDLDDGKVTAIPLPLIKDKLPIPSENIDQVLKDANEEIAEYNKRVSSITKAIGADKLVLQIDRAKRQIDTRIDQLNSIIQANQKNLEQLSPLMETQKAWDTDLINAVQSGTLSLKDAYDTILFQYQSRPEALIHDITNNIITVPAELKDGLLAIANQEISMGKEKEEKEKIRKQKEMEEKAKQGIPEIHETEIEPFTKEDIPSGKQKYRKVDKARSIHHEKASLEYAIKGSQEDINRLTKIKQTIEEMEKYMGALKEGQRSKNFLNTPAGKPVLDVMNKFLEESMLFITTYNINTKIVQDNKINPKLFGPKGTKGNALLAASMMRMYNVVKETIKMYTGGDDPGGAPIAEVPMQKEPKETKETPAPEVSVPTANSQNKITRMSELLWKAFEERMKLK